MKKIIVLLTSLLVLGCDDGNFSTEELNFDDNPVQLCGKYVFYKLSDSKKEALIIYLNTTQNILETIGEEPLRFNINNTTTRVVYRIFDAAVGTNYFCSDIPPTQPNVMEEWTAPSGIIEIITVFEEDDQDGLDRDAEGINYDDLSLSLDTDGDGLPDYKDDDDDGDNVATKIEDLNKNGNFNDDDTDGDGIPNYLDPDDDGDGVLTRYEEAIDGDLNPANDFVEGTNVPKYLDPLATESNPINKYREHKISNRFVNQLRLVGGFKLENGRQEIKFQTEVYEFGPYIPTYKEQKVTPEFK